MTFKQAKQDPRFLTMSEGNKKLKPTDKVKFLIWNIPAVTTCPYATPHCKGACYALKAEKQYPSCRESRERHYLESLRANFVERMIFTIEAHLNRPAYQKAKRVVIRIHESGDFYSREYLEKWVAVARHFEGNKKVVFACYTKSLPFFVGIDIPANMPARSSLWDDTEPEMIALTEALGMGIYTAVEAFADEPENEQCHCECCSTCFKCFCLKALYRVLKCEIH